jgi:hypothetical protein
VNVTERVRLADVVILADPDEPSYVTHGVRELQEYLGVVISSRPVVLDRWDDNLGTARMVVAVGRNLLPRLAAHGIAVPAITDDDPGPQGFVLRSTMWTSSGQPMLIVAGSDAQGTKHGLIEVIKAIVVEADGGTLSLPIDRKERQSFARRGMYAHQHWQFAHPYALRSWSLDDWKRYVDLLAYLHVNLFQIWSMVGLLPHPLSAADRAYLEKLRAVVSYAQDARGMEVWIGDCANNIAATDGGTPIETREYFAVESRMDPGDPGQFARVMESREDLYSIVNNANGYWIIDGDPGGWPGSPVSEFVDIMVGNRRLIDRCNAHGADARFVYWMHWGWSNWGWPEDNPRAPSAVWRASLEDMGQRLPEPWWLAPNIQHLEMVGELGLLGKSVFFPYGVLEYEPGPPLTHLHHARLKEMVDVALAHPGLAGVMGQCQTPLVQLPNIFFFMRALWDAERRQDTVDTSVRDLAALLYPASADLLGQAWANLGGEATDDGLNVADALDAALTSNGLGPVGPLGRLIVPDATLVAQDLVHLLRIRGYAERFRVRLDADDYRAAREDLASYARTVLAWQARHGYHAMGGAKYVSGTYREPINEAWLRYVARTSRDREHGADFDLRWPVKAQLTQEGRFPHAAIDLLLLDVTAREPLRS